jgi:hypothetical protein
MIPALIMGGTHKNVIPRNIEEKTRNIRYFLQHHLIISISCVLVFIQVRNIPKCKIPNMDIEGTAICIIMYGGSSNVLIQTPD